MPVDVVSRLEVLEARLGRRMRVRLVRAEDPRLLGRIRERGATLVLECNDFNPGFFWHIDVLRVLLQRVEEGVTHWDYRDHEEADAGGAGRAALP